MESARNRNPSFYFFVFLILFLTSHFSLPTAFGQASQFAITSQPFSITADNPSPSIVVEAQDGGGALDPAFSDTADLFSGAGGLFSADRATWSDITFITFSGGCALFYYKNANTGAQDITVSRSGLITAAAQQENILARTPSESNSFIYASPVSAPADNSAVINVTVTVNDASGLPIAGKDVTIVTARGDSDAILPSLSQVTDLNGQAAWTVASASEGWDTFTCVSEGVILNGGIDFRGLAAIWILDDDADDKSGYGFNCTVNGAGTFPPPLWAQGRFGGATGFDGVDDYLDAPFGGGSFLDLGNTTDSFTVECWFKSSDIPGADAHFFSSAVTAPDVFAFAQANDGSVRFTMNDGSSFPSVGSGGNITDGQWHHLAGVRRTDDPSIEIWVDGTRAETAADPTQATDIRGYITSIQIGGNTSYGTFFKGALDDLKVCRRALTAEEIAANSGRTAALNVQFTEFSAPSSQYIFRFLTPPFTATAGNPSGALIIEAWDSVNSLTYEINDTAALECASGTGKFSADNINWLDTDAVTLVNGKKAFYFRDSSVCGPEGVAITVSRPGLRSGAQQETVSAQGPGAAASYMTVRSLVTVDNIMPATITITVADTCGFPVAGKQVTIQSYRNEPADIIIQPAAATDANGQCTGHIIYQTPGFDSVSALCEGVLITRGVDSYGAQRIYHFDSDLKDYSGKSGNAVNSGALFVSDAPFGYAARFDGIGSYIECDSSVIINTSLTVEAWTKVFGYPSQYSMQIFGKGTEAGGLKGPWTLSVWSNDLVQVGSVDLLNGTEYLIFGAGDLSEPFTLNAWTHLVCVFSAGNVSRTYVNGVEKDSWTFAATSLSDNGLMNLRVSNSYPASAGRASSLDGIVDEVKIYDRVFTADEVGALYRGECLLSLIPARFLFMPAEFRSTENNPTLALSIEARNADGGLMGYFSDTASLFSASPTGRFSVSSTEWSDTSVITFSLGRACVYYKDPNIGPGVISVSRGVYLPDTLTGVIEQSLPSETCSYLSFSPQELFPNGADSSVITVSAADTYGFPVTGRQVTIYSARGGQDTVTRFSSVTDSNGQCTGMLVSNNMGPVNVYAICEGCAITGNMVSDGSFEKGGAGWSLGAAGLSAETSAGGMRSAGLSASGADADGCVSGFIGVDNDRYAVYRLSALVAAKGMVSCTYSFGVDFYSETGSLLARQDAAGIGSDSGWKFLSATFGGAGSGAQYGLPGPCSKIKIYAARLWNDSSDPAGMGWTDSVRLERVPSLTLFGPTRITFVSAPFAAGAGLASDTITVQAQFDNGNRVFNYNEPCTVASSSATGRFAPSASGPWSARNVAVFNCFDGETSFFYRDYRKGDKVITVSASNLPDTSQTGTVSAGAFSPTASYMVADRNLMPADGATACTILIFVSDSYRSPASGRTVTLLTTNPAGYDTVTYRGGQATDANGFCTAVLVSTFVGDDTPSAVISGESGIITRMVFRDGIAGMWNFEEGTDTVSYDISCNSNTGVVHGMDWVPGRIGLGLHSDGNSRSFEIPHSASLNETNHFTIEAWIYPQDAAKNWNRVAGKGWYPTDLEGSYLLYVSGHTAFFGIYHGGAGQSFGITSGTINDSQWYHIAGVFDYDGVNDTMALYVNGERVAVSASPTHGHPGPLGNTQPVIISSRNNLDPSGDNCFIGTIDEVSIHSRALPPDEIKADYLGIGKPIHFHTTLKLAIVSEPRVLTAGKAESITVQVLSAGNTKAVTFNGNADIYTSSLKGGFAAGSNANTWTSPFRLKFSSGETIVYYRDNAAGIPLITVSGEALFDTSQSETVIPSALSLTASYIVAGTSYIFNDGVSPCAVTVFTGDYYRNPVPGNTVTVLTTNPADVISYPSGRSTDENGICTASVTSTQAGRDTVTATVSGYPDTIANLVFRDIPGAWNFDEGAGSVFRDLSVNGNDGVLLERASWTNGRFGSALSFSETSYVQIPGANGLQIGKPTQSYSCEVWFRSPIAPAGDSHFFSKWGIAAGNYTFSWVQLVDGKVQFRIYDGAVMSAPATASSITDGLWHHLVGVRDAPAVKVRLYVDGIMVSEVPDATTGDLGNPDAVKMGRVTGSAFTGALDDARIYGYAMDSGEAAARYAGKSTPVNFIEARSILIITPPRAVQAGEVSDSVCVRALNQGLGTAVTYEEYCKVVSSSPTCYLSDPNVPGIWSQVLSVKMSQGEAVFFYKDTRSGSPAIVVTSTLFTDTQVESVGAVSAAATSSYIVAGSSSIKADGISPCSIVVVLSDPFHNRVKDAVVTVHTSNGAGLDTVQYPSGQTTDDNGMCTAVIYSSVAGRNNVSVTVAGMSDTVTVIYFDDITSAMWSFEEGAGIVAHDGTSHGNNGTLGNNPSWTQGRSGQALLLNGGYVTVPDVPGLRAAKFTLEAWIYPKSYSATDRGPIIISKYGPPHFNGYMLLLEGGSGCPAIHLAPTETAIVGDIYKAVSPSPVALNQWHHIVGTFDGAACRIYVNGALKASASGKCGTDSNVDLCMGACSWDKGGGLFNGIIDEARVYNRAFNETEVASLYSLGALPFRFTASKFIFTTQPIKMRSGSVSGLINAAAVGDAGGPDNAFSETVQLSSTSESAMFSFDGEIWTETGVPHSASMPGGTADFYYRDVRSGLQQITISRADLGITPGVLDAKILPYSVGFPSGAVLVSSSNSTALDIFAFDYSGETDTSFNDTMVLRSTSSKGRFSLSGSPWQDTTTAAFSAGALTVFYRDTRGGTPTVIIEVPGLADFWGYKQLKVTMPVIAVTKSIANIRTGKSGSLVEVSNDTIQCSMTLKNRGTETAVGLVLTDTFIFDSSAFSPVDFISMETLPGDSWAYAKDGFHNWQAWDSMPAAGEDVKGVRWAINSLAPGEQKTFKFKVKIK